MNTRTALEELVNSIRKSSQADPPDLSATPQRLLKKAGRGDRPHSRPGERGSAASDARELQREREKLERRAVQLDRMEEILRKMLRAVERREDEVRERERRIARFGFDDDMKVEILRREQALREAEERLAERERFIKESESVLLVRAEQISGL